MRSEKKFQHVCLLFEVSLHVYAHVHVWGGVMHVVIVCVSVRMCESVHMCVTSACDTVSLNWKVYTCVWKPGYNLVLFVGSCLSCF